MVLEVFNGEHAERNNPSSAKTNRELRFITVPFPNIDIIIITYYADNFNLIRKDSLLLENKNDYYCLCEFSFDQKSMDASVFGKAYLYNNLPIGFNTEIFADNDMEDFGRSILSAKGGGMTSYGAVSGRGQSLFAPVAKQLDEEETEDIEDDESENETEGLEAILT